MEAPGEAVQEVLAAARDGRAEALQVLVESYPDLAEARNDSGISAIVIALYHGHPDIARWLAARRRALDIFEAAALGGLERVEALIAADAGLAHVWSPDGFTALGLASFFGHLPVVRALIQAGADVNAIGRNPGKYTPLTAAVTGSHPEVVAQLLGHGADANYRYGAGYTPLHVAAANGSAEVVRLLLSAGARPDARADDGQTPREFALHREKHDVAAMLERAEVSELGGRKPEGGSRTA